MFYSQDFDITGESTGMELSGEDVLDSIFDLRDVNSWGMFGVLLAWIALFRFGHYFIFMMDVRPYLNVDASSK